MRPNITGGNLPGFFWLGILILLPLVILASLGIYGIRQDRLSVEGEALQRAQVFAEETADRLWHSITNLDEIDYGMGSPAFQKRVISHPIRMKNIVQMLERNSLTSDHPEVWFDTGVRGPCSFIRISKGGELIFPRPYSPELDPRPLDLAQLNPMQRELWSNLQAGSQNRSINEMASQWRAFLATHPPEGYEALARFRLGFLLENADAAQAEFRMLLERYPESVSENGLSLNLLAQARLTELALKKNGPEHPKNWEVLNEFYVEVLRRRGPLTSVLLDKVDRWSREYRVYPQFPDCLHEWDRMRAQLQSQGKLFAALKSSITYSNTIASPGAPASKPGKNLTEAWPEWVRLEAKSHPDLPQMFEKPLHDWLAVRQSSDQEEFHQYIFYPVQTSEQGAVRLHRSHYAKASYAFPELESVWLMSVPEKSLSRYMGVRCRWGGGRHFLGQNWRKYYSSQTKKDGPRFSAGTELLPRLLSVGRRSTVGSTSLIEVEVSLLDPGALYQKPKQRAWWLGGLLALSTGAAGIGLGAAWKAFRRQQLLLEQQTNFVSSVSHELRAPIAAVRMMAETLEEGLIEDPAKRRQYFHYIVQECRRLSSMVANVLDFARIEQNRKEYELTPTDILRLVEDTTRALEAYANEKQVRLSLQLSPVADQPNLDGRALQQALVNLIDNAIKHSPSGQTVTVGLESADRTIKLWVADHGPGIPPQDHQRIFERFYRRGSELRRETAGVGIGLSIVKHIVEAHRGRIGVESQEGKGSRFTIELPLPPSSATSSSTSLNSSDHE